jgi:hypothetical protein
MSREDFVNVRLTKFGAERAAGGSVQVHAGNHSFVFEPGEVKLVTRAFDWNRVLKNEHFNGHQMFEIVPDEELDQSAEKVEVELREDLGVQTGIEGGRPTVETLSVDAKEE